MEQTEILAYIKYKDRKSLLSKAKTYHNEKENFYSFFFLSTQFAVVFLSK